MRVLMISTDWRIATLGSKEYERMKRYASVTEELHIIVFTMKNQELEPNNTGNLHIYPTKSSSKWLYGLNAYFIAQKLKKNGMTLVTAQDPFETGLIGFKIAKKFRIPFQVQLHTDFASTYYEHASIKNRLRVLIADYVIPKANCIRVVSKRLQQDLVSRYQLSKAPMVLPIHLDIPVSMLSDRRDLLHAKYPQFGTIAVMISRLEPEKNIDMAFQAIAEINPRYPGLGLVIVGEGSSRPVLEKMTRHLGIEEKVIFTGWADNQIPYFLSADLFLNTSNYEGYGRTLMEAAAAGCPIVTTNVGIVGEILNENNALISEPKDVRSFVNNFERALKNPNEMKERASKARDATAKYMSYTENDRLIMFKSSWENCGK